MGTWNVFIFSDDTACDVRGLYTDLLRKGMPGEEATAKLLLDHAALFTGAEESVAWLALAATQWKLGRLEATVKDKAIAIIESGQDLVRWKDEPAVYEARKTALDKLLVQLQSKQPKPKIMRAPKPIQSCDWKIGDVLSFKSETGKYATFRVIGLKEYRGAFPSCELLDDSLTAPATKQEVIEFSKKGAIKRFDLQFANEIPPDRILHLGSFPELPQPSAEEVNSVNIGHNGKLLDQALYYKELVLDKYRQVSMKEFKQST